jgi:hypothetical protein
MESSHRWKHSASTPHVAGHRIKSFEPMPLGAALMSPQRLSPRRSTLNYFEDTLEIARLHIAPADYPSRKRQSRAGTAAINGSPTGLLHRRTMPSPLHRVVPDRVVEWSSHRHPTTG